ncbi:MAG TPA: S41 family peptidase, partial [bacterium]
WRFRRILKGANWAPLLQNPLEAPDVRIREGDCLLSVDGEPVSVKRDIQEYLVGKAGKTVTLVVNDRPDTAGARTVRLETLRDESAIRHFEWKEANYERVSALSSGRIGYMHLSDMDEDGIGQFEQAFRAERFREGLVVDVRDNTGGFVSWFLIDKLERKPVLFTRTRDFAPMQYPHGVHPGPLVFLCNENTASDGELFIEHVKALGLGPVVGTPTWGGLLGFNNLIPTLDEGLVTQSNVGFTDRNGRWIVENSGARPDVLVENRPEDVLSGRDRQLEKAVEICMRLLGGERQQPLVPSAFPEKH